MAGPFFSDVLARYDALGQLSLCHDYRLLTWRGLDSNGRVPTLLGTPQWTDRTYGPALWLPAGAGMILADQAELRLTNGTILAFYEAERDILNSQVVAYKWDGVNTGWAFQVGNPVLMYVRMNAGFSSEGGAFPILRRRAVGVSWTSGQRPKFFRDGYFTALGDNVVAPTNNAAACYLWGPGVPATWTYMAAAYAMCIFNVQVPDEDIYQIDLDFAASKPRTRRALWNIRWNTPLASGGDIRLDLLCERRGELFTDRSPTGNNVQVILPGWSTGPGVFDKAIKCGGQNGYGLGLVSAANNITGDMTWGCWFKKLATGNLYLLQRVRLALHFMMAANAGNVTFQTDGMGYVTVALPADPVLSGAWHHVVATGKGSILRIFCNGLQIYRSGAYVPPSSDVLAGTFFGIDAGGGGKYWNGYLDHPVIKASADSPESLYRQYLEGARKPVFEDDFSGYPVSVAAAPVGAEAGPFRVVVGSASIVDNASLQKSLYANVASVYVAGPDKDPCGYGAWRFKCFSPAGGSVAFVTMAVPLPWVGVAGANGYYVGIGSRVTLYRITNGAVAFIIFDTAAGALAQGVEYDVMIVRLLGGIWCIYLKGGVYTDWTLFDRQVGGAGSYFPATDNTYLTAPFHGFGLASVGSTVRDLKFLQGVVRPDSFPWEFSTGTYAGVISSGLPWKVQVTAGIAYLPKDLDWQTVEWRGYKGADANVTDWLIATELLGATGAAQNGYGVRFSSDERLQLLRMDNGVVTVLGQTAAAYLALMTEYQLRVTRSAGSWNLWIKGGAYAVWTLAVGPVADATYTEANFWVESFMTADRSTAPSFYFYVRSES